MVSRWSNQGFRGVITHERYQGCNIPGQDEGRRDQGVEDDGGASFAFVLGTAR